MTDAWRRVDQVLQAALLRPPDERDGFLREACAGDTALEKEVRSLLAADEQAGSFLEDPAIHAAARAVAHDQHAGDPHHTDLLTARMALSPGSRLGPYKISGQIGAGGMGEVYRAVDTNLGRHVAIKVLPEAVAADRDRLARFDREGKTLAALNHPNIAAIYGLERSGGTTALVMELVEGLTLADRIAHGAIPVAEALPIAQQIAAALEAAHEQGIVHRDLKPANIKLRPDGTVKVLDFGLATSVGSGFPTDRTTHTRTAPGTLVGTVAYMSPEQARAERADKRTDIWAFGCVLYEMLTGKNAFRGDTVTDTLAAVIRGKPDWSLLPADAPHRLRALLHRCLQKEPKQRLRDIGEARIAIEDVLSGASPDASGDGVAPRGESRPGRLALLGLGTLLLGAGVGAIATWNLKPSPESAAPVARFQIDLPAGQRLATSGSALALSADGSQLAYVATSEGSDVRRIYLRAMNTEEIQPVAGTEGAMDPFFSPDDRWLGFFAGGKLAKIPMNGGVAQPLAPAALPGGASWGRGTIVFSPQAGGNISQLSDQGVGLRSITQLDTADAGLFSPEILPGGKAVLFARFKPSPAIAVQSIGTGKPRVLIPGPAVTAPRYVSSGHLIYARMGTLMAAPFDAERLEIEGDGVPVVPNVLQTPTIIPWAQYAVSASGSLAYVPVATSSPRSQLVWVDKRGRETFLPAPPRDYDQPRILPHEGGRIALNVNDNARTELWLYDLAKDSLRPFPLEGPINAMPLWTPNGTRIAYMSSREGPGRIFWQPADGSGAPERLTSGDIELPFSWSPDGQTLAFVDTANLAIWMLHLADRKPELFLQASGLSDAPQFSPDGQWVAYVSEQRGRREIYVQPYPGPGGKRQISTDGGTEPTWNPQGGEIFYRLRDKMMAVEVTTRPSFSIGKTRVLFEAHYVENTAGYSRPNYDVSPDGQRFLMLKPVAQQPAPTRINFVLNWTQELKRLVPTRRPRRTAD